MEIFKGKVQLVIQLAADARQLRQRGRSLYRSYFSFNSHHRHGIKRHSPNCKYYTWAGLPASESAISRLSISSRKNFASLVEIFSFFCV